MAFGKSHWYCSAFLEGCLPTSGTISVLYRLDIIPHFFSAFDIPLFLFGKDGLFFVCGCVACEQNLLCWWDCNLTTLCARICYFHPPSISNIGTIRAHLRLERQNVCCLELAHWCCGSSNFWFMMFGLVDWQGYFSSTCKSIWKYVQNLGYPLVIKHSWPCLMGKSTINEWSCSKTILT